MSLDGKNQHPPEKEAQSNVVSILKQRTEQILTEDSIRLTADAKHMLATMVQQFREIDVEKDPVELFRRIKLVGNQISILAADADTRGISPEELQDRVLEGEDRTVRPATTPNFVPLEKPENIGVLIEQAEMQSDVACGLQRVRHDRKEVESRMKEARDNLFKAAQELFLMMMQKAREQKPSQTPNPDDVV